MAAEGTDRSALIDESPIAPVRPTASHIRQNSLEKHLQSRPDPKELKERHILLDTNAAPALQSAAYDLERQRASDNLKKGLEHRPQRENLVERNILPSSSAAPAIQGQQQELKKHMLADSLNDKISNRPKPEDLVKGGILQEDPTSPVSKTKDEADRLYEERIEDEYAKREGGA